jgi:uncharacterized protein DUF4154
VRTFTSTGVLLALLTAPLSATPPAASASNEYAVKSVFVYNFCRFIEWPDSAFASPKEPLVIGIVGQDPFGALLKEAVEGETYHNRPIQIEHYRSAADIRHCHLLFVSHSESGQLSQILGAVEKQSVVTVGETEDFVRRGGMIALMAERNRVRLEINPSVLRAARLDVSSKLLRVADLKP